MRQSMAGIRIKELHRSTGRAQLCWRGFSFCFSRGILDSIELVRTRLNRMKASFIIPLYNCLPLTQAMLASLQATLPTGEAHEILFVDDGSTDGTRAWLARLPAPSRAILNEQNLGFAGACNRGAAAATGELLFFLNNDLILLPGWYEPMRTLLTAADSPGLVGNIQRNAATGAVDHTGIFFNHLGKPQHRVDEAGWFRSEEWREVPAVTGACFGIRRETWRQLGGFDEGFVNGCEDVDLGLRARAAGFRNRVALRSVVRHHISQSAGRKQRDEHNTARLVERWRDTLAELAAPAWSRHQVADHAERSDVFDYAMLWAALGHVLFGGDAPPRVQAGIIAAINLERRRWRELLDGVAPTPQPFRAGPI
jgi:GT2 family glycosyltransferase